MTELEKWRPFLNSVSYKEKKFDSLNLSESAYPFVTISSQEGAGANELVDAILDLLRTRQGALYQGWTRFNQELQRETAKIPALKHSTKIVVHGEYLTEIEDIFDQLILGHPSQHTVYKKIFQIIRALASKGKFIAVKRGGAFITFGHPLGIHVRLVAPLDYRIAATRVKLGMSAEKAKKWVLQKDRGLAKFAKDYFNRRIDDPLSYDVVWNTKNTPVSQIAWSVVALIEKKAENSRALSKGA
ncbi:MAG TPA: cytidylate kinase-like family protein [Verrucomicrobiae bacterium]|jgi:hypothetical protein|nr:cytidylate kinase-like family protein [Verrucomicrobiae bacterium]